MKKAFLLIAITVFLMMKQGDMMLKQGQRMMDESHKMK
jgi:hypothetical protein